MKKKLLMSAALLTACCAVSTPVLAKEDAQPWVNKQSADEEHVIKETGTDKRFSIGKTVSVKLDSAYVTKDTDIQLAENTLYDKVKKLIPAPFHCRSVTVTKEMTDYIDFPKTIAYQERDAALSLHGDLQCMQVVRGAENTVTATYTGVLLAE